MENAQWGVAWPAILIRYYPRDELNENEMDGACGTGGGYERWIQGFVGETWGKEINLKT
jgi:hypothetical protein